MWSIQGISLDSDSQLLLYLLELFRLIELVILDFVGDLANSACRANPSGLFELRDHF